MINLSICCADKLAFSVKYWALSALFSLAGCVLSEAAEPGDVMPGQPWMLATEYYPGKLTNAEDGDGDKDFPFRCKVITGVSYYRIGNMPSNIRTAELLRAESGKKNFISINKSEPVKNHNNSNREEDSLFCYGSMKDDTQAYGKDYDYMVAFLDPDGKRVEEIGPVKVRTPPVLLFRLLKETEPATVEIKIRSAGDDYAGSQIVYRDKVQYNQLNRIIKSSSGIWRLPLIAGKSDFSPPAFVFKPDLRQSAWNPVDGLKSFPLRYQLPLSYPLSRIADFAGMKIPAGKTDIAPVQPMMPQAFSGSGGDGAVGEVSKGGTQRSGGARRYNFHMRFPSNSKGMVIKRFISGEWAPPDGLKTFLVKKHKDGLAEISEKSLQQWKIVSSNTMDPYEFSGFAQLHYYEHAVHPGEWIYATWTLDKIPVALSAGLETFRIENYSEDKDAPPVILTCASGAEPDFRLQATILDSGAVRISLPGFKYDPKDWEEEPEWRLYRINERFKFSNSSGVEIFKGPASASSHDSADLVPGETYKYLLKLSGYLKKSIYVLGKGQASISEDICRNLFSHGNFNLCRVPMPPQKTPAVGVWSESPAYEPLAEKIKKYLSDKGFAILEREHLSSIRGEGELGRNAKDGDSILGAEYIVKIASNVHDSKDYSLYVKRNSRIWPFSENFSLSDLKSEGRIDEKSIFSLLDSCIGVYSDVEKGAAAVNAGDGKQAVPKSTGTARVAIMPFLDMPFADPGNSGEKSEGGGFNARAAEDLAFLSLSDTEGVELLDRSRIAQIIEEQSRALSQSSRNEIMMKAGNLLSARYFLAASFGADNRSFQLNMRMISVESSEIVDTVELKGPLSKAPDLVVSSTRKMLRKKIDGIDIDRIPEKAVKLKEALDIISTVHYQNDKVEDIQKALESYKNALLLAPESPLVLERLAGCSLQLAKKTTSDSTPYCEDAIRYAREGLKVSTGWNKARLAVLMCKAAFQLSRQDVIREALSILGKCTGDPEYSYDASRILFDAGYVAYMSDNFESAINSWYGFVRLDEGTGEYGYSPMNNSMMQAEGVSAIYNAIFGKLDGLAPARREEILLAFAKRMAPDYPYTSLHVISQLRRKSPSPGLPLLEGEIRLCLMLDPVKAIGIFDEVMSKGGLDDSQLARALYSKAIALQYSGNSQQASEFYRKACETCPAAPWAAEARTRIEALRNASGKLPPELIAGLHDSVGETDRNKIDGLLAQLQNYTYSEGALEETFTPAMRSKMSPEKIIKMVSRYFWNKGEVPAISSRSSFSMPPLVLTMRNSGRYERYSPVIEEFLPLYLRTLQDRRRMMSMSPMFRASQPDVPENNRLQYVTMPGSKSISGWRCPFPNDSRFPAMRGISAFSAALNQDQIAVAACDGYLYNLKYGIQSPLWKKKTGNDESSSSNNFFPGSSRNRLLSADNKLYLAFKDGTLLCLDSADGREIWLVKSPGLTTRKTVFEIDGSRIRCQLSDPDETLLMHFKRSFGQTRITAECIYDISTGSLIGTERKVEDPSVKAVKPVYPESISGLLNRIPALSCCDSVVGFNAEYIAWQTRDTVWICRIKDLSATPYDDGIHLSKENVAEIAAVLRRESPAKSSADRELRDIMDKLRPAESTRSRFGMMPQENINLNIKNLFMLLDEESGKALIGEIVRNRNGVQNYDHLIGYLGYMADEYIKKPANAPSSGSNRF
ncbi:MAG TPA: hypothetical protein DET40_00730 [Lentisphaeria bacterium]|nr:MAG: hypothetical protein A2X45_16805 [Lentisphaerae bacterium GWF2_50_93]HCE42057.1 hypothetical protein [Lentisphaeria bacterium]